MLCLGCGGQTNAHNDNIVRALRRRLLDSPGLTKNKRVITSPTALMT